MTDLGTLEVLSSVHTISITLIHSNFEKEAHFKMSESPKRLIKTRTLVTTLQSLLVLPSISASIAGDVLPEAVLIKNILEEMIASLVRTLCHTYQLSPSNQASHIIFDNPISLK